MEPNKCLEIVDEGMSERLDDIDKSTQWDFNWWGHSLVKLTDRQKKLIDEMSKQTTLIWDTTNPIIHNMKINNSWNVHPTVYEEADTPHIVENSDKND